MTYERTDDPALFREAGRCFGRFHDLLDDFDASLLHETIPYFHHEPRRWQDFLRAVEENRSGRADTARKEIEGFMGWLEGYVGAKVEDLTPKTVACRATTSTIMIAF